MFCNGGSFGINTCLRAVKKIMIRSGQGQYTMGGDTTHTNGFNADDRGNWRHHNSKLVHGPHHHSIRIDNPNITLLQLQYSDINMKISLRQVIQMAFFLCVTDSLLRHPWTDLHETLRVNRSHPKLVQRHIFDFRFRPETGKEPIF